MKPVPTAPRDRRAGAVILILALSAGGLALGFRVNFMVDPVGPRAFPLVAIGLLLIGAAWMVARPTSDSEPPPSLPIALAAIALAAVPILISWLGFVVTVGGAMAALAFLMGGRLIASGIAALAMAAALFLLFAYLLGVPLPVGRLFLLEG